MIRPLAALSTLALLSAVQPAWALDAQAFLDRVEAVYEPLGYVIEFGPGELDGDTITVESMRIGILDAGEDALMAATTPITFMGVTERPDGGYLVREAQIPDINTTIEEEPGGEVSIQDIRMTGLYIPAGDPVPYDDLLQLIATMETGAVTVTRAGQPFFDLASARYTSTFSPAQGETIESLDARLDITDIDLNLSEVAAEDPAAAPTIQALGLERIQGDITQHFTWTMDDGRITMDEFRLAFDQIGTLDLAMDFSGLTPETMAPLYAMQDDPDADTEAAAQAQAAAGMDILGKTSLHSAAIRYDDAGLAGKLLDLFAAQQGADRATLVEGLKQAAPALIGQNVGQAVADLLTPPLQQFLDDPQSLELSVAPAEPTSLLVLLGAAANPAGLVSVLNVTAQANTAATTP